jgi:hypothetical protein
MKRTNTPGCFAGRTDTLPSLLPDIRYSFDQPAEREIGKKGGIGIWEG